MDGRQFDSMARRFASKTSRRGFIWRGAALAGSAAALSTLDSASAARRGENGISSICRPDGAGGYYRDTVATRNLQAALNAGAIVSDCCAHAECGTSNECGGSYCDFGVGACVTAYYDGSPCDRAGCLPGTCSGGQCYDPEPHYYMENNFCQSCTYDTCGDLWSCWFRPCGNFDYQCADSYCDPVQAACVIEPILEGEPCITAFGDNGACSVGLCRQK